MANLTAEVVKTFLSDDNRFNVAVAHAALTGQETAYRSLDKVVTVLETELTEPDQISDLAYWAMKAEINSLTVAE